MRQISAHQLKRFRQDTFGLRSAFPLRDQEDAIRFVNERGFVFFWPIKGIVMPSLWAAVAGERPVADAHDDPGHVTWGWKDDLLGKRQWYYAKVLRGKATMIALDTAPHFYALSENYGDPDHDYLDLYNDGLLSREAKIIYETLLRKGPLNTVKLRQIAQMTGKKSNSPFDRGLTTLQRDFKILPIGVAEAGAWRYSFVYELVHRHYPELPEQARPIARSEARARLVTLYFASVGAATEADVRKLFQWPPRDVKQTLSRLEEAGRIRSGYQLEGRDGDHFVLEHMGRI